MPIVMLNDDIYALPNPLLGEDGLVAVGGDLHPKRLIHAYKHGIFPWYGQKGPILWHAPDPRFVITKASVPSSQECTGAYRKQPMEYPYKHIF